MEFHFPVRDVVAQLQGPANETLRVQSVPISLQVRVVPIAGELRQDNNQAAIHLRAITRRNKLLLLDGRARWEMRYVRNLFERDTRWQVTSVLAGAVVETPQIPRGPGDEEFPPDRAKLFEYDLLVVGDIHADVFREDELQWLKDFVEQRGGGMIMIDGSREGLKSLAASAAGELLPVKWLPGNRDNLAAGGHWDLTKTGQLLPALALAGDDADNRTIWQQLPAPHQTAAVEALPGTETLAEIAAGHAHDSGTGRAQARRGPHSLLRM